MTKHIRITEEFTKSCIEQSFWDKIDEGLVTKLSSKSSKTTKNVDSAPTGDSNTKRVKSKDSRVTLKKTQDVTPGGSKRNVGSSSKVTPAVKKKRAEVAAHIKTQMAKTAANRAAAAKARSMEEGEDSKFSDTDRPTKKEQPTRLAAAIMRLKGVSRSSAESKLKKNREAGRKTNDGLGTNGGKIG